MSQSADESAADSTTETEATVPREAPPPAGAGKELNPRAASSYVVLIFLVAAAAAWIVAAAGLLALHAWLAAFLCAAAALCGVLAAPALKTLVASAEPMPLGGVIWRPRNHELAYLVLLCVPAAFLSVDAVGLLLGGLHVGAAIFLMQAACWLLGAPYLIGTVLIHGGDLLGRGTSRAPATTATSDAGISPVLAAGEARAPVSRTWIWLVLHLARVNTRWWSSLAVLVLFLVSVAVRFHSIALVGSAMYGDEAATMIEARNFLTGLRSDPFVNDHLANPILYEFMLAQVFRVTGVSVLVAREFAAIWGALCVPLLYGLARETGCRRSVAFGAAGFLATAAWHVHFSTMSLVNIHMVTSVLAALYCAAAAVNRRSALWALLAGASTAMALNSYIGGRVIIPILALWSLYLLCFHTQVFLRRVAPPARLRLGPPLGNPGYRMSLSSLVIFVACMCVTALVLSYPLIHYYLTNAGELSGHTLDRYIFSANGIQAYRQQFPNSPHNWWNILWYQLSTSIGMFTNQNSNTDVLFHQPGQPLLDSVSSVFFVIGLATSALKWQRAGPMLAVLSLAAAYVFGTVLTIQPPSTTRPLTAAPLLSLFSALGVEVTVLFTLGSWRRLDRIIARGRLRLTNSRLYRVACHGALSASMALVVIVVGAINVQRDADYVRSPEYVRAGDSAALAYGQFLGTFGYATATIISPYGYPAEFVVLFAPHVILCNGLWGASWHVCPPAHVIIFDDPQGTFVERYRAATGFVAKPGRQNRTGQPAFWYVASTGSLPDPAHVVDKLPL